MNRVYRRMMIFSSTVVFLALAPLLVMYAIGYRFSLESMDPVPVGVVLIGSNPRGAEIFLDDKKIGHSPHSISNIPTGTINLRLSKEGYIDWKKNIPVKAGLASEVRDIRLFPQEQKFNKIVSNVQQFSLSPNRHIIALADSKRNIRIIDELGTDIRPKTKLKSASTDLLWSPDSSLLIIKTKKNHYLFNITGKENPKLLSKLKGAKDLVWDPRIAGRLLFINPKNQLEAYNVINNSNIVIADNILLFATSSRFIYALNNQQKIITFNLQGKISQKEIDCSEEEISKFLITPHGKIAYLSKDNSLWIVEDGKSIKISDQAINAQWSPDGKIILVQPNPKSLFVFNVSEERVSSPLNKMQLVIRLSRNIKNPQWFAGNRHLLYQVDDEILITEIDTRDHPITYQVSTTNIGNPLPAVGEDGDMIFYLKAIKNHINLVVSNLVVSN